MLGSYGIGSHETSGRDFAQHLEEAPFSQHQASHSHISAPSLNFCQCERPYITHSILTRIMYIKVATSVGLRPNELDNIVSKTIDHSEQMGIHGILAFGRVRWPGPEPVYRALDRNSFKTDNISFAKSRNMTERNH
jgi:hypothetical protein